MKEVSILGAGIAGMTAGFILAQRGIPVVIYEKGSGIGETRVRDIQGLENWIFRDSVPEFFASMGLNFSRIHTRSVKHFQVHLPDQKPFAVHSRRPFFYLVHRGSGRDSIDRAMYELGCEAGVRYRFSETRKRNSVSIVATGATKAAGIAHGALFKTGSPDQVHLLLGNECAPFGYAYVIVMGGEGTVAAVYKKRGTLAINPLERTLNIVQEWGLDMRELNYFSGRGSFSLSSSRGWDLPLVIGEEGGYQDYLFGFGMRMGMRSAYMAVEYLTGNRERARNLARTLKRKRRLSYIHRLGYEQLSDSGKALQASRFARANDPLALLTAAYGWSTGSGRRWMKSTLGHAGRIS